MRLKEWMQCARKICHTDFWSAYQHKRGLLRLNPYAEIDIYACDFCGGLHVGNQLTVMMAERSLKKLNRMMEHPNFERKTPLDVRESLQTKRDHLSGFVRIERERKRVRVIKPAVDVIPTKPELDEPEL